MKCLITGGAGFIGSNIAEELLKQGYSVRILDNFSTGRNENLEAMKNDIEIVNGDIRDFDLMQKCVDGIDYVFHEAALPSVPRSIKEPISSNEVNITGSLNVLEASRLAGVKRVVYASSSSVYGDNPILPKKEDMVTKPLSPYAVTKLAAEQYCKVYYNIYGLETVALRYFNVFGPKQDPNSQYAAVIPRFISNIIEGISPLVHGDGEQSRDFTFIANVVDANIKAATTPGVGGSVFNIACGERITVNQMIAGINEYLGKNVPANYGEVRAGDIKHSLADISEIQEKLAFVPKVSFAEGLKATIEFFRS